MTRRVEIGMLLPVSMLDDGPMVRSQMEQLASRLGVTLAPDSPYTARVVEDGPQVPPERRTRALYVFAKGEAE